MGPNANSTNATPFSFLCQSQSQIWDEATIWKAGRSSVGTNNPASQPALPGTTQERSSSSSAQTEWTSASQTTTLIISLLSSAEAGMME